MKSVVIEERTYLFLQQTCGSPAYCSSLIWEELSLIGHALSTCSLICQRQSHNNLYIKIQSYITLSGLLSAKRSKLLLPSGSRQQRSQLGVKACLQFVIVIFPSLPCTGLVMLMSLPVMIGHWTSFLGSWQYLLLLPPVTPCELLRHSPQSVIWSIEAEYECDWTLDIIPGNTSSCYPL